MENCNQEDKNRKILQDNLCLIRRDFGWTADELAQKIGTTRQTIKNLENIPKEDPTIKITQTQYLAIKQILWEEIIEIMRKSDESKATMRVMEAMLKDEEIYPDEVKMLASVLSAVMDNSGYIEEKSKIIDTAEEVTPTLITKTNSRKLVSAEFLKKAGLVGGIITAGIVAYFLKGKDKK